MWLKAVFWYLVYLLKYLLIGALISGIVAIFFPIGGFILGLICLIGAFPLAKEEYEDERAPVLKEKAARKRYKKLKHEFRGFDEALQHVRRGL